jgi:two-component system nitrogen regulation response regulator NtrX
MTPGKTITNDDIPDLSNEQCESEYLYGSIDGTRPQTTLREAREGFEREFITQKLEENDWNISRTAELIELERSNLHRKIKNYRIDVRK